MRNLRPILPALAILGAVAAGMTWSGIPGLWADTWAGGYSRGILALRWGIYGAFLVFIVGLGVAGIRATWKRQG